MSKKPSHFFNPIKTHAEKGSGIMSLKPVMITAIVLAVNALLSAYRPGGMMAYFAPSVCWALVALATLWASGFESLKAWYRKPITLMAAAVAVASIFILIDAGLFTGFGKSPYSFTPLGIAINLIYVSTNLLGVEFSRAYLMKSYGLKRPILTLGIVTLLYTLINTSLFGLLGIFSLENPLRTVDYLGSTFLPTLTANLLASYLALLGGPIASLAYRSPLEAFQWFFPILPDLTWGFKALLGVVPPTLGYIYVNQAVTLRDLRKIGIRIQVREPARLKRQEMAERSSLLGWTAVSVIGILTVWFSTGLLGVYPTVTLSGSMRPTMEVGDLAILVKTRPEKIRIGDIIQFWKEGEMVMHRVHEIETRGARLFITKGDANNAPDADPVSPAQIRGKLITFVPKMGWVSIYIKRALSTAWTFLSANTMLAYGTLAAISSGASIYAFRARKNRLRN